MINIHKTMRQYDGTECNLVLYYVVQTWKLNCFKELTILSLIYITLSSLPKLCNMHSVFLRILGG